MAAPQSLEEDRPEGPAAAHNPATNAFGDRAFSVCIGKKPSGAEAYIDTHDNLVELLQALGRAAVQHPARPQLLRRGARGALVGELERVKPAASKGKYVKKVVISTTMGPGIRIEPSAIGTTEA